MNLKKVILLLFIFLLNTQLYSDNKQVIIGVSSPFTVNNYPETVFIQKHFSSELIFNNEYEEFDFNIIRIENYQNESDYLKFVKEAALNDLMDYLIIATVYSNNNYIFIYIKLINPYNDLVIFSKIYSNKTDYTISEFLIKISKEIINKIYDLNLKQLYSQKNKDNISINNEEKKYSFPKLKFKHEFFIQNGFFKNHPKVISFIEFIMGYNFIPFNFFCIEGGVFVGTGYQNTYINLDKITFDKTFVGTYGLIYFFLPGIVEPGIGLRFDFSYIVKDMLYFTFPIVLGLKINIKEKNSIRINASFQFMSYDFLTLIWKNDYIIGFYIGYGRKI